MFDYRAWIERAVHFTERLRKLSGEVEVNINVDPPALKEEVANLECTLSRAIPAPIRHFLIDGSRNCSCKYVWDPPKHLVKCAELIFNFPKTSLWGGAQLCNISDFAYSQSGCLDQGSGYHVGTQQRDFWHQTFPFIALENGDYIGLYLGKGDPPSDCPVVYLDHEGDYSLGDIIALDFDKFLVNWESLDYIGLTLIGYFIDIKTGQIIPKQRDRLRALFLDGLHGR